MPILQHHSSCWECCVWNLFGDKVCGMKAFSISLLGFRLFCLRYPAHVLLKIITGFMDVWWRLWMREMPQGGSQVRNFLGAKLC